jgi:hypothetical protein
VPGMRPRDSGRGDAVPALRHDVCLGTTGRCRRVPAADGVGARLPKVKRTVLWLFGVSAIPCTAPVGAIWGLVWYPSHRDEVNSLPSLYPALCKIGLGLSVAQTVMFTLMGLLYAVFRGS